MLRRLLLTWQLVKRLDILEAIATKIEALQGVLVRLESIERQLPTEKNLEMMVLKLSHLDATIAKIENLGPPAMAIIQPASTNGAKPHLRATEHMHAWKRLKLLSEFVALSEHAEDIEKEWQRIQQDEHDYQYAFNAKNSDETQAAFVYRKGLVDGIKWVKTLKDRFS